MLKTAPSVDAPTHDAGLIESLMAPIMGMSQHTMVFFIIRYVQPKIANSRANESAPRKRRPLTIK